MPLNWTLSPLMRAVTDALDRLGGVARESDLHREAASRGEGGPYGDQAHFAKGTRELKDRGILATEMVGDARMYMFSPEAWADMGRSGEPPRSQQLGML